MVFAKIVIPVVEVYFFSFIILFPLKNYHHLMNPITHPSTFYTSYDIEHLWFTLMIHDCYHLFIPLIDVYTILNGLTPTLLFTNLIVLSFSASFRLNFPRIAPRDNCHVGVSTFVWRFMKAYPESRIDNIETYDTPY